MSKTCSFENVTELDSAGTVARAVESRRAAYAAEAELLAVAAHWADLHAVLDESEAARIPVPGTQRLLRLAGPGTPDVAEFAPAELAAALAMSTAAGQQLIGDALELRHRLPRLWARIASGSLPAWRGRQVAHRTTMLPADAAAWVDVKIAPYAHKIGPARVANLVEAALIRFDPAAAAAAACRAADTRGVWLGDTMTDGTRSIQICADALDATAFDSTLDALADTLAQLGDDDLTDVRRAKAGRVLADPQAALDLLTRQPDTDQPSGGGLVGGGLVGGGLVGGGLAHRRRPRVTLYLHLSEDAVRGGTGVARVEGLAPVTLATVRDWIGRADVRIQPVLDLPGRAAVDAYEVPDRIAETVLLRSPCCPFPWCDNVTRNKDTDHITAYRPPAADGPPGQTSTDNLAPPCRRHHRLKTHGGWTYTMPEPGLHLWRSPSGRRYLVDHTGTTALSSTA